MQGGGQFTPRSLSWPLPYDCSKELIGKGDPGEVPDKTVLKLRNVKDPLRFAVRAEGRTRPPNLVLGYFQQPAMTREEAWCLSFFFPQGRWSMAYMLGMKRLCPSQTSPPHWERNRSLNGSTRQNSSFSCLSPSMWKRQSLCNYISWHVTFFLSLHPSLTPDDQFRLDSWSES